VQKAALMFKLAYAYVRVCAWLEAVYFAFVVNTVRHYHDAVNLLVFERDLGLTYRVTVHHFVLGVGFFDQILKLTYVLASVVLFESLFAPICDGVWVRPLAG
jgi:hypothetical protein